VFSLLLGLLFQTGLPPGSIEGFVVRAGTNPPSALVNARLELSHASGVAIVRTDATGRFVFAGLPSGYFGLRVTKDGYIRQEYRLPLVVTPGQELKNIVFRMEPAPTISGVIRDENEGRISGVLVQALRRVFDTRGNAALSLIASTLTDDRGNFRLYWLDPGEYVVSATPPPATIVVRPSPEPATKLVSFMPTFFPGYVDPDYAKPIRLDPGRDASGMDFKMIRQTAAALSGSTISLANGRPAAAEIKVVPPEDGEGVARYSGKSFVQTGYAIDGVAPGSYIVSAATADGMETAATRIRIRNVALRVNLELGAGLAIGGRVSNPAGLPMDLRNARLLLSEMDPSLPKPAAATIGANNQFSFAAVHPGNYTVRIDGLIDDQYMIGAVYGSTDVLEKPMPVAYGPPSLLSELEIRIGLDGGRIAGAVYDRNNSLFSGAQVILVPTSVSRFRFDRYRTAIAGSDGQFTIRGIAPGEYKLFAWENLEPNAYLNIDFMRPYEDSGAPVLIEPGGTASVPLRVIPASP
jgi:hypothetical protein